jgi:hypothetical protein
MSACHLTFLRRIFGPKKEETTERWGILHNEEEQRPLGRSKSRPEDNIETDLRKPGVRE